MSKDDAMGLEALSRTGVAGALVAGTVAIHSAGSFFLVRVFKKYRANAPAEPGYALLTAGLTTVVLCLLFLHLVECGLWAAFFYFDYCFSSLADSVYFSLITYATVGYGDVVLSR